MEITAFKEDGNRLEFEIAGTRAEFVNALRRHIMNTVPVFAIEEVTFYENNSAYYDEFLAHRIGLIPITTPAKVPENAEILFHLDAAGPKMVYSEELQSKDSEIVVARPKIPIVQLKDKEVLRLEGKAILANAQKHAKFQAGIAAYEPLKKEGSYKFMVESFYQMSPKELLMRAVVSLEGVSKETEDLLEKAAKKK
jgi:DNA-directed RNA polymerase subunit D